MQISSTQHAFLTSTADIVLLGGAAGGGKSHAILLDPLRHCQGPHANQLFRGAMFRKTYPQLTQAGGLLDSSRQLYSPMGAVFNQTRSEWTFPCGAKISLSTLQYERDIEEYLGAQFDWVAIDEAAAFTQKNVLFLWGRCRSKSGVRPTLRMTCNPDHDSFLYRLVHWWLDPETGYPDASKSGVIRHFVTQDEELLWTDEPVFDEFGAKVSTSFTFIPSKLTDNTHLMKSDPQYRQRLMSLPTQERERFLEGCWFASSKTDSEWERECFMDVTIPIEDYPDPDVRRCVRMFTVDASKGKKQSSGDYSSIVCLCQTEDLKYVDADLKRRPPGQIVEDLFLFTDQDHHKIRSGDLIGIESLQFQEIFVNLIMQYASTHPEYALSKYLSMGNIIIPVEDMLKKEMRIRRLDGPIRKREFRFVDNPGTSILLSQLRTWDGIPGKGKHDDGPDSLDMAQQLPVHLSKYYDNLRKKK